MEDLEGAEGPAAAAKVNRLMSADGPLELLEAYVRLPNDLLRRAVLQHLLALRVAFDGHDTSAHG